MASNISAGSISSVGHVSLTSGIGGVWDLERGFVEEDPSRRPQAGPLPRKPGEIGYEEAAQSPQVETPATTRPSEGGSLLERHPADRDSPATSPTTPASSTTPTVQVTPTPPSEADTSSTHSAGKHSLMSFLKKSQRLPKVGGITMNTLLRLVVHVLFLVGTIVAWAMVAKHIPPPPPDQLSISTTQIFIHVVFVIAVLVQLIFFERIIFRVRAERYAYVHPGHVLPTARQRAAAQDGTGTSMGLAPWNRPPLPTYAAALAAEGLGTGDVEDNIIAVPPPPAYGNTRGSTLLLAGLMPENLRAQRTRERVRGSETVRGSLMSRFSRMTGTTARSSRPVSYRSTDSAWEERMDADRALVLEETLARLEEGKSEEGKSEEGK
ncbi:hypothetical protein EUX98_g7658 [Antrodiella citrinella]|uniref:Uncharacterized protein n=1 Tax=Antrodiella citrinella TaxID=2447956 RepID=A0A4S4MLI6_9APHY|nr:hypothetical protein EUX98_g7658 [Antrodiella citrinella]